MSFLPGKFVWFEHVSNDPTKARSFYGALVGWVIQDIPMGEQSYSMIFNGGTARENGIGGFRTATAGIPNHWISYLSVPDVDRAHASAVSAGAQSLMAPAAMGPGRASGICDPAGALLALWKGGEGDPADVEKTPFGGWFWNEHYSADPKGAVAFYEKAFGLSHDAMDMGLLGTYYILKSADGKQRAGLMQFPPGAQMPSHWLPYIHVPDCDAAVGQAQQLGAQMVCVPPTDIPNIGRFAVLIDAVGVPFAVIRGATA
ncbi:MAG: hypothetical protein RLZZ126_1192 [Pseudomonadota bacterium]|jgi:uncharacterized protein